MANREISELQTQLLYSHRPGYKNMGNRTLSYARNQLYNANVLVENGKPGTTQRPRIRTYPPDH